MTSAFTLAKISKNKTFSLFASVLMWEFAYLKLRLHHSYTVLPIIKACWNERRWICIISVRRFYKAETNNRNYYRINRQEAFNSVCNRILIILWHTWEDAFRKEVICNEYLIQVKKSLMKLSKFFLQIKLLCITFPLFIT